MEHVTSFQVGDPIVIYRTSHGIGRAEYQSVATSICVLEEYRHLASFASKKEFIDYCVSYSVFDLNELERIYEHKKYVHVIKFSYNVALNKRIIRKTLADTVHLDRGKRWGAIPISQEQFIQIAQLGQINESLIINKA